MPTKDFLASIAPPLPYSISTNKEKPIVLAENDSVNIKICLKREADFNLPVRFFLTNNTKGIKMKPVLFEGNMQEAILKFETIKSKPSTQYCLSIKGLARKDKKIKAVLMNAITPAFSIKII
ncbi:hypothetical protein E9993_19900 [Labilibacter sediminis]|nr:hypothetical protein E9993_19900 [Labilibacter sediminis]